MLRLLHRAKGRLRRELHRRSGAPCCPVCGACFDAYADLRTRKAAACPACGALERHRLSWLYLKRRTTLFTRRTRLLHVAPEPILRQQLARRPNVVYTPASYDPANPAAGEDIRSLSFADASFDLIYCSHVLEHVPDDRRAMRELARVLAPGGTALILVPQRDAAETYEDWTITSPEERAKAFGQADHLRWYGRDIVDRLQEAGFAVEVVWQHTAHTRREQRSYGLTAEPIFVCTRR